MDEKYFSSTENIKNLLIGGQKISELIEESNFTLEDFKPYVPLEKNFIKKMTLRSII